MIKISITIEENPDGTMIVDLKALTNNPSQVEIDVANQIKDAIDNDFKNSAQILSRKEIGSIVPSAKSSHTKIEQLINDAFFDNYKDISED